MIVLKWLLAMLLTSVPFVFHYCIKPKAASSDKWRNFYSFLSARMPWLKRKALAVKAWISYVYHKMYRSDNGRKFFTLVLVICMLVFQVVDFYAAKEACSFPTLILLMAGMVYPFKQLPPVPGMKSRWRSLGSWPRGRNAA